MKKTIYTLNINDYAPEICEITYPLIQKWADKIGAEFVVIRDRKFPEYPVVYEKLQIYTLAKERGDDWIIFIDSDTLVHPDMFDPTEHLPMDTVMHHGEDFANNRWKYDNYFRRDGRNIGSCNWLAVASKWCLDLWKPLDDLTLEEAILNIFPTQIEKNTVIESSHLIDDYTLSRNIAKYGLKHTTFYKMMEKFQMKGSSYFYHEYLYSKEEKVILLKNMRDKWLNYKVN